MASIINATTTNGVAISADNSGILQLATNSGTTAVTIDASQNVGIGTASPNAKLEVYGQRLRINAASDPGIELANAVTVKGYMFYDTTNDLVALRHASTGTGVAVDSSSNVLLNTTDTTLYNNTSGNGVCYRVNSSLDVATSGDNCLILNRMTSIGTIAEFRYAGTAVGSISYNGSLTLYNQTSDERLKENIVDSGSGIAKLNKIQILEFDWIESKQHTDFGVIAQEINLIAPELVTVGENNEDGTIKNPWQVDTSVLVPTMIKAIQELKAIIDTQQTQITALNAKVGI